MTKEMEYLVNPNAPEVFASGLFDVEIMAAVARLVLYVEKRTATGVTYRETCVTCIVPTAALPALRDALLQACAAS